MKSYAENVYEMETLRSGKGVDLSRAGDDAESLAIEILSFLGSDSDRLSRFLDLSGISVGSLRARMADPTFCGGVLDYLMQDDRLLTAFASSRDRRPEHVAQSIARLRGMDTN